MATNNLPPTMFSPLTVPIPEACRMLGIGRTKLHEMMSAGEIRAVRIAGRTLIDVASLRALVASAPAWKAQHDTHPRLPDRRLPRKLKPPAPRLGTGGLSCIEVVTSDDTAPCVGYPVSAGMECTMHDPCSPDYIYAVAALVRFLEQAALAVVATDPVTALRLALLASEMRPGGAR